MSTMRVRLPESLDPMTPDVDPMPDQADEALMSAMTVQLLGAVIASGSSKRRPTKRDRKAMRRIDRAAHGGPLTPYLGAFLAHAFVLGVRFQQRRDIAAKVQQAMEQDG